MAKLGSGRALISVEWVEKCIDDNELVAIDPYRITSPITMNDDKEDDEDDDDFVEITASPKPVRSQVWRLPTPELSPPSPTLPPAAPPSIDRKPIISSVFKPCPEPEPMGQARKKARIVPRAKLKIPISSIPDAFAPTKPPVPIAISTVSARHPSPVPAPATPAAKKSTPSRVPRWNMGPDTTNLQTAHVPHSPAVTQRAMPAPDVGSVSSVSSRREEVEVIDLILDDDEDGEGEEGMVEQILPEQTPIPRSPTAEPHLQDRGPSAAREEFEAKKLALARLERVREAIPSLFKLSPSSRRFKQEPL